MQLEEAGNAKDVPPLSNRGIFGLSTIIIKKNTFLNRVGLSSCGNPRSLVHTYFGYRVSTGAPD
jgi:hypothetical protein